MVKKAWHNLLLRTYNGVYCEGRNSKIDNVWLSIPLKPLFPSLGASLFKARFSIRVDVQHLVSSSRTWFSLYKRSVNIFLGYVVSPTRRCRINHIPKWSNSYPWQLSSKSRLTIYLCFQNIIWIMHRRPCFFPRSSHYLIPFWKSILIQAV